MEDYSNLQVVVNNDGNTTLYNNPRLLAVVVAAQSGMSSKAITDLLRNKSDEELQALVNVIGQEYILPSA